MSISRDILQKRVDGNLVDIAPVSNSDAIKVGEGVLTDTINDITEMKELITYIAHWEDGNPTNENRIGRFVTLNPGTQNVSLAGSNDRIFGVTIESNLVEYPDEVCVCLYGKVILECLDKITSSVYNKTKSVGISDSGRGILLNNSYGYDVMSFEDNSHVSIFFAPNTDNFIRLSNKIDDIMDRLPSSVRFDVVNDEVSISH